MSELSALTEEIADSGPWKLEMLTLLAGKIDVATIRAVLELADDAFSEGVEAGQSDW